MNHIPKVGVLEELRLFLGAPNRKQNTVGAHLPRLALFPLPLNPL